MRVSHLSDSEIQHYLDNFSGHGRIAVDSLDSDIRDHLNSCDRCQENLRGYARLYGDLACEPEPVLPTSFAHKVIAMLPGRRRVPPVLVVPVTLGWAYAVLLLVTWWLRSLNWVGISTWGMTQVVDLAAAVQGVTFVWQPMVYVKVLSLELLGMAELLTWRMSSFESLRSLWDGVQSGLTTESAFVAGLIALLLAAALGNPVADAYQNAPAGGYALDYDMVVDVYLTIFTISLN